MYGYQGAGSRKEVVLLIVFLLIGAFAAGVMIADSYWGNPPREEAEAEQIRIQNRDLEERQRIDREAYQQQKDNEVQALKEQAERALMWRDRWNELGMVLAAATVAGLLIIAGVRMATPVAAQAYERYTDRRTQLVEQQIRLEEMRAKVLRQARQREEISLQRARVTLAQEQDGGNGRGHSSEQSTTMTPPDAGVSSTRSRN